MDLVNLFGTLNGFQLVLDRFLNDKSSLTVALIAALVK